MGKAIKSDEILYIISEISEALSLTSKTNLIVEAALDSISENLKADCCWIHFADGESLSLASSRSFTQELRDRMVQLDMSHQYGKEVIGLANRIIITDLSMDNDNGNYGLSAFEMAGFRSLIVVPIVTYRVLGAMGVAYRSKKDFSNDLPQLFAVIASLVGMALKRSKENLPVEDMPQSVSEPDLYAYKNGDTVDSISSDAGDNTLIDTPVTEDSSRAFQEHVHRMGAFRKAHK